MVARHHNNARPSGTAFGNRGGYFGSWRVNKPDQPQKLKAGSHVGWAVIPCFAIDLWQRPIHASRALPCSALAPMDNVPFSGGQMAQIRHRFGRTFAPVNAGWDHCWKIPASSPVFRLTGHTEIPGLVNANAPCPSALLGEGLDSFSIRVERVRRRG